MNMKKKLVTVCLVACMAVTAVAGGTLAYFTDAKDKTNTFTVGNVTIELTEPNWGKDQGEDYTGKLVPGGEPIAKDPTITLADDSEDAWVFAEVKVGEDLMNLMRSTNVDGNNQAKFEDWLGDTPIEEGWTCIDSDNLVYAYNTALSNEGTKVVTLFDEIKAPDNLDSEMIEACVGENPDMTITITAKALQKEAAESADINAYNQVKDITVKH